MMKISSDLRRQSAGVLLLRYTVAILMLFHGVAKLQRGLGGIEALLAGAGLPTWIAYGVFVGEIVAPLLVMAGVLVRTGAWIMVINMIVAVGLAHPEQLFAIGRTGGYALELQAFFLFASIAIALLVDCKRS